MTIIIIVVNSLTSSHLDYL